MLEGVDALGGIGAADKVHFLENLEGVDHGQHKHQKRGGQDLGQRDRPLAPEPAGALQAGVFIQGLRHGLQRGGENNHAEPKVFPDIEQHNGHTQGCAFQPEDAVKAHCRHQTVDRPAVVKENEPDDQHGSRGHQIGHEQGVAVEGAACDGLAQHARQQKGKHENHRSAQKRQFDGVFQTQLKHLILPHAQIVVKAHEAVVDGAVGQAEPYAPYKGHQVKGQQAYKTRQQIEPDGFFTKHA